ncbi:MAG TPA: HEAT repeat domain-containing protein [Phototrophicaceae bacterium]|nr:HEAT repeat domain-containing protein [Phototrophicaceae bacterium]
MDSRIEDLINSLRSGNWDAGRKASLTLAEIGAEAVAPLIGVLREYHSWDEYVDDDNPLHFAEEALIKIGAPAVEELIAALKEDSWGVRVGAVAVLGEIGDVRAVQPLIGTLRYDGMAKGETGEALVRFGDVALRPLLYALKNNDDPAIRSGAAAVLTEFSDPLIVPALIEAVETDKEAVVRQSAVYVLSRKPDTRSIEPLVIALEDPDPAVREETARALGEIGAVITSSLLVEALTEALTDPDWGTRQSAAEMLIRLKTDSKDEAERRLLADLQNEDVEIRLGSAWSLMHVGDERALEPLVQLLYHDNTHMVTLAAVALGKLGDQRAVIPLTATLNHADQEVRDAAKAALRQLEA